MKLRLETQSGVSILHVSGDVSAHQFDVLHAGIKKFLTVGKNQIIVALEQGSSMDNDAVRKISELNTLAKELSGEIIIVVPDEQKLKLIQSYSKPPLVSGFPSIEKATEYFKSQAQNETIEDQDRQEEEPLEDSSSSSQIVKKLKEENETLKKQLTQAAQGELKQLKSDAIQFKKEKKEMEAHIQELLDQKRLAPNKEAYEEKIKSLQERIKTLMEKNHKLEKELTELASSKGA